VFVNQDASGAHAAIGRRIAELLFHSDARDDEQMRELVAEVLAGLRRGTIDRSLFTPNGNAYFSETALADIRGSLRGLGKPKQITRLRQSAISTSCCVRSNRTALGPMRSTGSGIS